MITGDSGVNQERIQGVLQCFVNELVKSGRLKDESVKKAQLNVPRHLFVDAYCDDVWSEPVVVDRHNPTEDQLKYE